MRVLVACEFSGVVRDAFLRRGHDATSCDIVPSEVPGPHLLTDVRDLLIPDRWDLLIAFPPCTYLCGSGARWSEVPGRASLTHQALDFVKALMDAPVPRIAIENPVGLISTRIRPPDQIIHPYQFGDDASKRTCLWLVNLPVLEIDARRRFAGRIVFHEGRDVERWSNQRDDGTSPLGETSHRSRDRSRTYLGIAEALASQWGGLSPVVRPRIVL